MNHPTTRRVSLIEPITDLEMRGNAGSLLGPHPTVRPRLGSSNLSIYNVQIHEAQGFINRVIPPWSLRQHHLQSHTSISCAWIISTARPLSRQLRSTSYPRPSRSKHTTRPCSLSRLRVNSTSWFRRQTHTDVWMAGSTSQYLGRFRPAMITSLSPA